MSRGVVCDASALVATLLEAGRGGPYDVLAGRVWELRHDLTSHDAAYVALAELVDADLVTLDGRISRAPALRCIVRTPDDPG